MKQNQISKNYERPAVVLETELEVRAGSPLDLDPLDILNLGLSDEKK